MLVCYGDTLIDIDLNKYINFYLSNKITVASYQLETSFGIFGIENQTQVVDFEEKPALTFGLMLVILYLIIIILIYLKNLVNLRDY